MINGSRCEDVNHYRINHIKSSMFADLTQVKQGEEVLYVCRLGFVFVMSNIVSVKSLIHQLSRIGCYSFN